jgi:membrane-associated phospholipid phosphatase
VVSLFEAFAHTAGVLTIVLAIAVLDRQHARAALRVAACALGSGLLADLGKLLIGRTRPSELWSTGLPDAGWQTFLGLTPVLHAETFSEGLRRGVQSFPSGHSAMAAGLAMGLAWLYPQGKWFFAFLAAMAMLQRIESGAHFPSDTLAAASLGVLFATMCCDPRLLGGWFDQWRCVK